jgi:cell division septal protein FtsQ
MKARRTTMNRRKGGRSVSRQHLLELNVRTASVRRQRRGKAMGFLWKVSAVLIVITVAAIGIRFLTFRFFLRNPEYALTRLVTHLNGVMTDDELIALTGLQPGKNILQLDLGEASRRLSALPEIRSVSIERHLPDTIEVGVERRHPMFLIGNEPESPAVRSGADAEGVVGFESGKSLLCDGEGMVMRTANPSEEFQKLPVLTGIGTASLQPGQHLEGDGFRNAVAIASALSDLPEETFQIRSVDVSKPYAIIVTDTSGARFTFGTKDLPGQIERLSKLLAHCQESGRRIATANLITQRNTPVTFVMTPEDRSPRISPVSSGKKPAKHP